MSFTDQLLGTIDERIAEATEQIASLEDALHALRTATRAPAPAPAVPATKRRTAKRRARKAPVAVVSPTAVEAPTAVAPSVAVEAPGAVPEPVAVVAPVAVEAAPLAVAPTAEAPTAEAPTAEAPTAEAPTAEAPTAEAPVAVETATVVVAPTDEGPAKRRARSSSRARSTRKVVKPAKSLKLDGDALDALLAEHPDGVSAVAISKQSGAAYAQVLELLRDRERSGEVRRTGERRASLWRLITDEERIAERAAELAARR